MVSQVEINKVISDLGLDPIQAYRHVVQRQQLLRDLNRRRFSR